MGTSPGNERGQNRVIEPFRLVITGWTMLDDHCFISSTLNAPAKARIEYTWIIHWMVQLNDALKLNVRFANRCDDCSENFEDSVPRRWLCATALPLQVRNDVAGMVIWQGGRPASANSWHHLTESWRELRLVETSSPSSEPELRMTRTKQPASIYLPLESFRSLMIFITVRSTVTSLNSISSSSSCP